MNNLLHNTLTRNTAKILTGNVLAQIISLIIYPILSRLYSPDDFGVLNVFCSIGGIFIILATCEYQNSIVIANKNAEASACLHLTLIINIIVSSFVALTILFAKPISEFFNVPALAHWYFLLPVYIFFSALWNILQHWYIRKKLFGEIGKYQVSLSTSNAILKSGFGYFGQTSFGLVLSMTVSPIIAIGISIGVHFKHIKELFLTNATHIKDAAKKYSNFPKYATPRMLMHYLISSLPILMLSPEFSAYEIGILGMAMTLAGKPINILTTTMFTPLFQRISEMVNKNIAITPTIRKIIIFILAVTIPFFIILYFILPDLTLWLLGNEWRESGELIRFMLPYFASVLVTSTLNFIPDIFQKQKITLLFEIVNLIICTIALSIGIAYSDFKTGVLLYYLSYTLIWVCEGVWIYHLASMYDKQLVP